VQATHFINSIISSPVFLQTVKNTLKEASFKAVVKKKKLLLSAVYRKRRLAFALKYQNWTIKDWKKVIWSDKTKINRIGSDGQEYVWTRKGGGLTSREVIGTVKFGDGSLMVWDYIEWNGVGVPSEIEGWMDAEQYVAILEGDLLQSMKESGIPKDEVIFQQDNDPKHTSRRAQIWFEEQQIKLFHWPAQLPDHNPIEHTWNHLKKCLLGYERAPTGVHQLWNRIMVKWKKFSMEECQKWIENMPRRIQAVVKAKYQVLDKIFWKSNNCPNGVSHTRDYDIFMMMIVYWKWQIIIWNFCFPFLMSKKLEWYYHENAHWSM